MRLILGVLVALLLIAHQDNWNWDNPTLVGGVVPIGLFYHACLSMAAAFVWFLATLFVWPKDVDIVDVDANAVDNHAEAN